MEHQLAELIGISAAAASLYAAHAKTIIPLRIAAIVANALAMTYSFLHGTYPTFALNAILLPLNTWRLRSMLHLVRDIDAGVVFPEILGDRPVGRPGEANEMLAVSAGLGWCGEPCQVNHQRRRQGGVAALPGQLHRHPDAEEALKVNVVPGGFPVVE